MQYFQFSVCGFMNKNKIFSMRISYFGDFNWNRNRMNNKKAMMLNKYRRDNLSLFFSVPFYRTSTKKQHKH